VGSLIGARDAILVADPAGRLLLSKNADQKLVPASILKVFTALVAFHSLGPDYRFATEVYEDDRFDLKVRGRGDPLLISEVVERMARDLAAEIRGRGKVHDLILDDSYFQRALAIPGVTSSAEPYDAPNGALCVNFNTIRFRRTAQGAYISDEPQTPLLPMALRRIERSRMKEGRIVFSHDAGENTLYAGMLLRHFLEQEGVEFTGTVHLGRIEATDRLLRTFRSPFSLDQVVARLLEYSNNFIANQLLIASGARAFGAPGTLAKGLEAALAYAREVPGLQDLTIVEGSGLSRRNRVSARQMLRVLENFEPYHPLMRHQGREFFKTGSLRGVSTRAGYIEDGRGQLNPYVVMVNTPGRSTAPVLRRLLRALD
jgi:D-alanyl-D-alanine carboxypeptidase/D-alanyl-D-alanine-endopeptidase (penicillin-binding protein 4)